MPLVLSWETEATVLLPEGGEAIRTTSEVLELDIIESDSYPVMARITAHAVEEGVSVTDHTEPEQDRPTAEAAISDRPMDVLMVEDSTSIVETAAGRKFLAINPPEGTTRKADAFEELRELVRNGTLVNVEGMIRPLENYQIESVTTPRSTATSGLLSVSLVFVEHRTAVTATATAPAPRVERGRNRQNRGRQSAGRGSDVAGASGAQGLEPSNRDLTGTAGGDIELPEGSTEPEERGSVLTGLRSWLGL